MDKIRKTAAYRDRVRGSLIGGAAGDALGYAIEFCWEDQIFSSYGKNGITEYSLKDGNVLISDDTQMTLFTASGILACDEASANGSAAAPRAYVADSYQDWLKTQQRGVNFAQAQAGLPVAGWHSPLLNVPGLYARRAPGNTCITGINTRMAESPVDDFIANPINNSKGCGGIMRIAPLALRYIPGENYTGSLLDLDMEAAQIAAITHSHPLGYMPAAAANHIISRCITHSGSMSLEEIAIEARDTMAALFASNECLPVLTDIIDRAIALSKNNFADLDNIHALGEGWVAEETLGIALYCALKYQNDFSKALIVSVNHRGDSDSTGAVTGNILGALLGYEVIEDKWKENLELKEVILHMADCLCTDY